MEGECTAPVCGDGAVDTNEDCDDGNSTQGDGCDNDCTFTEVLAIDGGGAHTCALIEGGRVRCWGLGIAGQLGQGSVETIGDDELPNSIGDVELPSPAVQITAGMHLHTCALLDDDSVYCWGASGFGQLGYGNTDNIGDDELPSEAVDVGVAVKQVVGGVGHTCARTAINRVRCWGAGAFGQLGYGNPMGIGDDELPSSAGDAGVGGMTAYLSAGTGHTCSVSITGTVSCWGANEYGQLGYGNTDFIGDDELPLSVGVAPVIPLGLDELTRAVEVSAGVAHTCALFETGDVLCWGLGGSGQLGFGDTASLGDDEAPGTRPALDLPDDVRHIAVGSNHSCALLVNDELYCWGGNAFGQLGYGDAEDVGDDELPSSAGPVELGGPVKLMELGFFHTCAVTMDNVLRCWGNNDTGQLGLGNTDPVGDNEFPLDVEPVQLF